MIQIACKQEREGVYAAQVSGVGVTPRDVRIAYGDDLLEQQRWYVEDFIRWHRHAATETFGAGLTSRLMRVGQRLHHELFGTDLTGDGSFPLPRVDVRCADLESSMLPWEILSTELGPPLSVASASFARTVLAQPGAPAPPSDAALHVLLIIARPMGPIDVPFRTVARYLHNINRSNLAVTVARPPTYEHVVELVQRARDEGRPFTLLHFDCHGYYGDPHATTGSSVPSSARGYLVFEDKRGKPMLVAGPQIAQMARLAGVQVVVLNSCRSAFSSGDASDTGAAPSYVSLAEEIVHLAGVPVLAMRYNVRASTVARFMKELYSALASRESLYAATAAARRRLWELARTEHPQDWFVPALFQPVVEGRASSDAVAAVPAATPHQATPNQGLEPSDLLGRDAPLLVLDRFLTQPGVAVLRGPIGIGKTKLASEFVHWFADTTDLPNVRVHLSSAESHRALEPLLRELVAGVGGVPAAAVGGDVVALTNELLRRAADMNLFWICDGVDAAVRSWPREDRDTLVRLIERLASSARIVVTTRESTFLASSQTRGILMELPPLAAESSLELIRLRLAERSMSLDDQLLLVEYCRGNPLAIDTLLDLVRVGSARTGSGPSQVADMIYRGVFETWMANSPCASQAKARIIAAVASEAAPADRARLTYLHLFRQVIYPSHLIFATGEQAGSSVPEFLGMSKDDRRALLQRAAECGVLSKEHFTFLLHPLLPWALTEEFSTIYGPALDAAQRSYVEGVSMRATLCHDDYISGRSQVLSHLRTDFENIRHVWDIAMRMDFPKIAMRCVRGVSMVCQADRRDALLKDIVSRTFPLVTDSATDEPRPGYEREWAELAHIAVRYEIADDPVAMQSRVVKLTERLHADAIASARAGGAVTPSVVDYAVDLQTLAMAEANENVDGWRARFDAAAELLERADEIGNFLSCIDSKCRALLGSGACSDADLDEVDRLARVMFRHIKEKTGPRRSLVAFRLGCMHLQRAENALQSVMTSPSAARTPIGTGAVSAPLSERLRQAVERAGGDRTSGGLMVIRVADPRIRTSLNEALRELRIALGHDDSDVTLAAAEIRAKLARTLEFADENLNAAIQEHQAAAALFGQLGDREKETEQLVDSAVLLHRMQRHDEAIMLARGLLGGANSPYVGEYYRLILEALIKSTGDDQHAPIIL